MFWRKYIVQQKLFEVHLNICYHVLTLSAWVMYFKIICIQFVIILYIILCKTCTLAFTSFRPLMFFYRIFNFPSTLPYVCHSHGPYMHDFVRTTIPFVTNFIVLLLQNNDFKFDLQELTAFIPNFLNFFMIEPTKLNKYVCKWGLLESANIYLFILLLSFLWMSINYCSIITIVHELLYLTVCYCKSDEIFQTMYW